MSRRTIVYRGSLKSCNYHCSYCPFSRRPASVRELQRDREQWSAFIRVFAEQGEMAGAGALLVTPYGEALIHSWYWEGLAKLSSLPWMDAVGAQTNLSFPAEESLARFEEAGGQKGKLRLWATFHPEMTGAEEFAERCKKLVRGGAAVCAGAVGVPEYLETGILQELRELLPGECYLWVNRMDGLRRAYTPKEVRAFSELDPYFYRELLLHPADPAPCAGRLMAEGDGCLRTCNIGPVLESRWAECRPKADIGRTEENRPKAEAGSAAECRQKAEAGNAVVLQETEAEKLSGIQALPPVCVRRRCSCYLAYGGRESLVSRLLFGPYPLFRIPRRPKAVFLDIAGTLLPMTAPGKRADMGGVPDEELAEGLSVLAGEGVPLFFATTLPCEEAARRCQGIWQLFSGGVFAGGAQASVFSKGDGTVGRNRFFYLEEELLLPLERHKGRAGYRILTYRGGGRPYKITLWRAARRPWRAAEAEEVCGEILRAGKARYMIEENCLQIVSARADKAGGVRTICGWLGIDPAEAFAAGDSPEDGEMCRLCGG